MASPPTFATAAGTRTASQTLCLLVYSDWSCSLFISRSWNHSIMVSRSGAVPRGESSGICTRTKQMAVQRRARGKAQHNTTFCSCVLAHGAGVGRCLSCGFLVVVRHVLALPPNAKASLVTSARHGAPIFITSTVVRASDFAPSSQTACHSPLCSSLPAAVPHGCCCSRVLLGPLLSLTAPYIACCQQELQDTPQTGRTGE